MNTKERVRNDILVAMRMYLDTCTMMVLDAVLVKAIQNVEMTETTTLPATLDDTNQYILNLFDTKKSTQIKLQNCRVLQKHTKRICHFDQQAIE